MNDQTPVRALPPTGPIITDEDVGLAADWLRDSAREIGDAKGEMERCSHMLKVVKALKMKQHNEMTAAKAEVEAYSSQEYQDALTADAMACANYEKLRALREAAALRIEVWRTEAANYRAMKI